MSIAALLSGVKTRLTAALSLSSSEIINVQLDPEPEPYSGQVWYSLFPESLTSDSEEVMLGLNEVYSIGVAVNLRLPYAPKDRQDEDVYLKLLTGMEVRQRAIVAALHQNWTAISEANTILTTAGVPATSLFIEPLRWAGTDAPQTQTAEYGHSDDPRTFKLIAWLQGRIRFTGARRVQPVGSTT